MTSETEANLGEGEGKKSKTDADVMYECEWSHHRKGASSAAGTGASSSAPVGAGSSIGPLDGSG